MAKEINDEIMKGPGGIDAMNKELEEMNEELAEMEDHLESGKIKSEEVLTIWDDISGIVANEFANSIGRAVGHANELDDIFKQSLESIKQMVVQALILEGLKTAFPNLIPILGGKTGGSFYGTNQGVFKAATGTSFRVPSGFDNDSFPLMVQSREDVTVKTPSQSTMDSRTLRNINNSIQALNTNFVSMNSNQGIVKAEVNVTDRDLELLVRKSERRNDRFR